MTGLEARSAVTSGKGTGVADPAASIRSTI